jgi:hypothetical protein
MNTLHQASKQWATRPDEERFVSLAEMHAAAEAQRAISRAKVFSSRGIEARPLENDGLIIQGREGGSATVSHWAFGQLAALAGAPGGYLRSLPAPLAADCINYGLHVERDVEDVGMLFTKPQGGPATLRAATGPKYGRLWNSDVIAALVDRFGDGVSGDFRVPGVFGRPLERVTKKETTLYCGDRDMFVFLADEENRIEMPDRRDGKTGALARGFFVSNSEVGAGALRVKTFLFDYVCANRIVWGALELDEISIRHTASAPDRFIERVAPALLEYSRASADNISTVLRTAQRSKVDKVGEFLAKRFGPQVAKRVEHAHMLDEGRPIETLWDVVTGATAYARSIPYTADRVEFEAEAGKVLDLVAA